MVWQAPLALQTPRDSGSSRVYQDDQPGPPNNLILQVDSGASSGNVEPLSSAELKPIVDEAARRFVQVLGSEVEPDLQAIDFQIIDLPGQLLGQVLSSTIFIDQSAAGFGWFIDLSPREDFEFYDDDDSTTLRASASSPA